MPYIGRNTDKLSNVEVLDNITFDGSSSYTLQKGGSNFTPSSANTLLVSIDGVVQAGNFTVSGSTIDFGTAVAGTSTCDFILHYGTGLITTPADGTVTTAKIGSNAVTTAKIADANVTSAKMFSGFANGITMADQWRLSADTNSGTNADVTTNWERNDSAGWSGIGTGLTESSGIFSFPQTGIYLIMFSARFVVAPGDSGAFLDFNITTDNSSYNEVAEISSGNRGTLAISDFATNTFIFNITNTTTHKFKFATSSFDAGTYLGGNTDIQRTGFTVTRIGDT